MSTAPSFFPFSSTYDSSEDLSGSTDPLGLLAEAERLAEVLLPDVTARMRHVRLLTFCAVASRVVEYAVEELGLSPRDRSDARLVLERLYVTGMVKATAAAGLPGKQKAQAALDQGVPLARSNYLVGAEVNGPFGVMARLARGLRLVGDEDEQGSAAAVLLEAWGTAVGLDSVLGNGRGAGAKWLRRIGKSTRDGVAGAWPAKSSRVWSDLSSKLQHDQPSREEGKVLRQLLDEDPVRRRVLVLVERMLSRRLSRSDRGAFERTLLCDHIAPKLRSEPLDQIILRAIEAIRAWEDVGAQLERAFFVLVWQLQRSGGKAAAATLMGQSKTQLAEVRAALQERAQGDGTLDRCAERLESALTNGPLVLGIREAEARQRLLDPLRTLHGELVAAVESPSALVEMVLRRHGRVQANKDKSTWLEREGGSGSNGSAAWTGTGVHWVLLPGARSPDGDAPPVAKDGFLHPYRVDTVFRFLTDLRSAAKGAFDDD